MKTQQTRRQRSPAHRHLGKRKGDVRYKKVERPDPLFDMGRLAVETGIPDLARNVDHYLYGHPKETNGY